MMNLPPRKVVQIAATADIQFSDGEYALHRLYALCDDGTIWLRVGTPGTPWHRIEAPPATGDGNDDADA
jgi:hypothetical protein